MELNNKLNEEMERRFNDLEDLETGSEEQRLATDNLVKLCNVKIALDDKEASRKADEEEQKQKLESRKAMADVALRVGTIVAGGIGALFAFGSNKAFLEAITSFEQTGTFCSISGKEVARNALNGLRNFKR